MLAVSPLRHFSSEHFAKEIYVHDLRKLSSLASQEIFLYIIVIKALDRLCLVELYYVFYESGLTKLKLRVLQRIIFLNYKF